MAASSTPASEPPEAGADRNDDPPSSGDPDHLRIDVAQRQSAVRVDAAELARGVRTVLAGEGRRGQVSLAIVDDATIHRLNAEFLGHDYPTDALSFVLESDGEALEGEVVISAETAARQAVEYGWSAGDELLLYAVHGALHLAGYDDTNPEALREMQQREAYYMQRLGRAAPKRWPARQEGASTTR